MTLGTNSPFDITQTPEFLELYEKGMMDSEIEDALKSTLNELEPINPKDLKVCSSMTNPPPMVVAVFRSMALIFEPVKVFEKIDGKKTVNWWATCKAMVKDHLGFIKGLKDFGNELSDEVYEKLMRLKSSNPDAFDFSLVKSKSLVAAQLGAWVGCQMKIHLLRQLYIKMGQVEATQPSQQSVQEGTAADLNANETIQRDEPIRFDQENLDYAETGAGLERMQLTDNESEILDKIDSQLKLATSLLKFTEDDELNELLIVDKPPQILEIIFEAICYIINPPPVWVVDPSSGTKTVEYWKTSQNMIRDKANFLNSIFTYDAERQMDYHTFCVLEKLAEDNPQLKNLETDERAPPLISGLYLWIAAQKNIYYLMNIYYKNCISAPQVDVEVNQPSESSSPERNEHKSLPKPQILEEPGCEDGSPVQEPISSQTEVFETQNSISQNSKADTPDQGDAQTMGTELYNATEFLAYFANTLTVSDISEMKSYNKRPESHLRVLEGVCYVLKIQPQKVWNSDKHLETFDWESTIKGMLSTNGLIRRF